MSNFSSIYSRVNADATLRHHYNDYPQPYPQQLWIGDRRGAGGAGPALSSIKHRGLTLTGAKKSSKTYLTKLVNDDGQYRLRTLDVQWTWIGARGRDLRCAGVVAVTVLGHAEAAAGYEQYTFEQA